MTVLAWTMSTALTVAILAALWWAVGEWREMGREEGEWGHHLYGDGRTPLDGGGCDGERSSRARLPANQPEAEA